MRQDLNLKNEAAELNPIKFVRDRNGNLKNFNLLKIENAITKAGQATGEFNTNDGRRLSYKILSMLHSTGEETPSIETIQDIAEEVLLDSPYKKSAKAYILYRDQHALLRQLFSKQSTALVDNYLSKLDWQVKENSNMSFSLQGLNHYISSAVSKEYWLNRIYPHNIREAHNNGDFHIHDLGLLSVYCVGWDLQDLLRNGFKGVAGKAASRPANHFRSALGQIVNFFYTLQGEAAGAQALANFDTLLAPFVRKDGLTFKEIKEAVRGFVFNLNVPTRVGFQTPFTNITVDLNPPSTLKDEYVVIGGELQNHRYGEFEKEMLLIDRALFEVLSEGDASGRVFTFPIPTINIDSNFNWDNPEIEPVFRATAKYGIPYFANFVNADISPDDARSMCCRLRLDTRELKKRGGGLFGANPLTGSIGVVTINLPRIGFQSETKDDFFTILKQRLIMAKESLEIKRKVLEKFTSKNLYPYTSFYLRDIFKRFGSYWSNHFSTIGIVGMHEACSNLLGTGIETDQGKSFALDVMDFIRDTLETFQEETGNYYNLEATPAESTAYSLLKLDQEKGFIDEKYKNEIYTNSTQLPTAFTGNVVDVIKHQDLLQSKYTGGTVLHVFTGEASSDTKSVKEFIKKICNSCKMPYFTITPTFSICSTHGYLSGKVETCPTCGEDCEIYSRVVGYLRPINQWNEGKAKEFEKRTLFTIGG
ncbi:MAG: ribonucleoside triphosphate reductase [Deltaproteobacteria bacterium]|nr:ribonucleoside triphosphate reductase [Deltaproteobacteria bacterium]